MKKDKPNGFLQVPVFDPNFKKIKAPKEPVKPLAPTMKEPIEPKRVSIRPIEITIPTELSADGNILLNPIQLLELFPKNIPLQQVAIVINFDEAWCGECGGSKYFSSAVLTYEGEVDIGEAAYRKELKNYQNQKRIYNDKMTVYNEKLIKFNEDYHKYIEEHKKYTETMSSILKNAMEKELTRISKEDGDSK